MFPLVDGSDMQHVDLHTAIRRALNERIIAAGGSSATTTTLGSGSSPSFPDCVAGQDIFRASLGVLPDYSIVRLQSKLEQLAVMYYNPANFVATTLGAHGWWTLPQWRTAAGINIAGFTRKIPDGAGGMTTLFGQCQVGDYVGPWIWNELYNGINVLTRRVVPSFGGRCFSDYVGVAGQPSDMVAIGHPNGTGATTWASLGAGSGDPEAAKTAAELLWENKPIGGPNGYIGIEKVAYLGYNALTWAALMSSRSARITFSCPDQITRTFDVYAGLGNRATFPMISNNIINQPDAFGDGIILQNNLVTSGWTPGPNYTFGTPSIGSPWTKWVTTANEWPTSDRSVLPLWKPAPYVSNIEARGYGVTPSQIFAVVTYDFEYHG